MNAAPKKPQLGPLMAKVLSTRSSQMERGRNLRGGSKGEACAQIPLRLLRRTKKLES